MNSPPGWYYQTALNFQSDGNPIAPEIALKILIQAQQSLPHLSFNWTIWNRPKSGETLLFTPYNPQQPNQIGDDGYCWSSYGQTQVLSFGQISMEVTRYNDGYVIGEKFVSMTKTRFRISVPDSKLQLIQYFAVNPAIQPHPRPVAAPVSFVKPVMVKQQAAAAAASVQRPMTSSSKKNNPIAGSLSKKKAALAAEANGRQAIPVAHEEDEDLSSDEYEILPVKDVSLARFQRNHDFMGEIFSNVTTGKIQ